MEIKVITETNPVIFEKIINNLLKDGWELHGTPAIETTTKECWGHFKKLGEDIITTYSQILRKCQRGTLSEKGWEAYGKAISGQ